MNNEKKIHNLKFGISVTQKVLSDNSKLYNVRVPLGNGHDVFIKADSEKKACKMAELVVNGGLSFAHDIETVSIQKSL